MLAIAQLLPKLIVIVHAQLGAIANETNAITIATRALLQGQALPLQCLQNAIGIHSANTANAGIAAVLMREPKHAPLDSIQAIAKRDALASIEGFKILWVHNTAASPDTA